WEWVDKKWVIAGLLLPALRYGGSWALGQIKLIVAEDIRDVFAEHPTDVTGRQLPSINDKLNNAASLGNWAGHHDDQDEAIKNRQGRLEVRVGDLENPKRKPR